MSKEDEDKYKRLIDENKQLAAKIKEVLIINIIFNFNLVIVTNNLWGLVWRGFYTQLRTRSECTYGPVYYMLASADGRPPGIISSNKSLPHI